MRYFAEFDGDVASGSTLGEAHTNLIETFGCACRLDEIDFYEGNFIKIEIQVKQTPIKAKTSKE